jgi:hypothetical protein
MTDRRLAAVCLSLSALVSGPALASPDVCSPLPAGTDVFPSTAKLVVQSPFFGQPFVVRLSSSGQPDAQVSRAAQVGSTINTQILQMQLTGTDPTAGAITLRRNTAQTSAGQIRNVVQNGACAFAAGDASFDVFVEVDVGALGETWINQTPVHLEAKLTSLPPKNVTFEVTTATAVALVNKTTLQSRGQLLYAAHTADPSYPPAGADCFDSLLSASVKIFASGQTSTIFGFGPTQVDRGPQIPGGFCQNNGAPCQTNANCSGLNTCVGPHVDTEIASLSLSGFDTLLGNFTVHVAPSGTSNCCAAHATPGCTDSSCAQLICAQDAFCCTGQWDNLCATQAQAQPACVANCTNPNAGPSTGKVQSNSNTKTYPATSFFDVFIEIDSSAKGKLHTTAPIHVTALTALRNLPPDPQTIYRYSGPAVALYNTAGNAVGEISTVDHTVQVPLDCTPAPPAGDDCLDSRIQVQLTVPPCPTETLILPGQFRVMRGTPYDPGGFGAEVIDTLVAKALFSGSGACLGPLSVRLGPAGASTGKVRSLAPREFFPADSFFDVFAQVDTATGPLTGSGPVHVGTTINALPPAAGEIYFGPGTAINLYDSHGIQVGQILEVAHEVQGALACPASTLATIKFPGPGKVPIDVGIPAGGPGVQYDVVRGDLSELRSTSGSFSSAFCLYTNSGAQVSDSSTPPAGAGYYYVARDGFAGFDGTWNSPGATQVGDRDVKIGSCP